MSTLKSKAAALAVTSTVATVAAAGLMAEPASAGIYPSGCVQWATFGSFSSHCWLGQSATYENTDAGFIYGIHYAIGSPYDGTYAMENDMSDAVEKRVAAYQVNNGLTGDAIVGTSTWNVLQSDLIADYCGTVGSRVYYSATSCSFTSEFFLSTSTAHWWVAEPVVSPTKDWYKFSVDFVAL